MAESHNGTTTDEAFYNYVTGILSVGEVRDEAKRLGWDLTDDKERPDALRAVALDMASNRIDHYVEQGYSRAEATDALVHERDTPEPVAKEVISAERDLHTNNGTFEQYNDELAFAQMAQEFGFETHEQRLTIWDELLNFTRYDVFATGTVNGEEATYDGTLIRQSATEAHNNALRIVTKNESHENYEMDEISVQPMERMTPDIDPLADMEEFA